MSEYTFVANNNLPQGTPSPSMIVTLREQRSPISPPSTLSPPAQTPPAPREPSTAQTSQSHDTPRPSHMQSVFSSQTGEAYRSQQHSTQVWESHKEEIRRLYIDENRPLKEVMAIMRQKGFRATVRMYKSRFDKWGFSKNNSKREVVTMLQLQRERNALGKRTAFHRNGREVAIDAYLKRKGISQYDLAEPGMPERLPQHLRCVTPPPETPILIPAGGALSLQELVLQCARDLAWNSYCAPDLPLVTPTAIYRGDAVRCAITDLTNADWLFSEGHYERGGAMCEQGFKSLHLMVQRPSIYGLLHLLLFHLDAKNRAVAKEVWRYLAAYSATVRSDGPLARLFQGIFRFLSSHDHEEYWDFLFACVEKLLLIDDEAQSGLPEGTIARLYPLMFIPRAYQYNPEPYRRLQSRCDLTRLQTGKAPQLAEEQTVTQASALLVIGTQRRWQGEEVMQLAEAVLENTKNFTYNVDFFVYIALRAMAHYHRGFFDAGDPSTIGKHELSIQYLERTCQLMEGKWDPDLGYFLGDLELLSKWHREAGDVQMADAAHVRWRNALQAIPTKWERGKQGILF
ncbi:Uu.00g094680.m01.CDS01 [Anthostomella pinea]|uniref:Uu.00g094680.m01.CDS01 n=1 Tax=Anthostomella pinea TaxID=933095 RepID=A0AAI8YKQ0_9PEZI|nr:Uu.00g094680.m01.CDS01 [Anthostomella pinea]